MVLDFTMEQRRVLLWLHEQIERAAREVEPRFMYRSNGGAYVMNREGLSDFVRRCFSVALEARFNSVPPIEPGENKDGR